MLGAIVGDTVGSIYEFNNTKDYNFDMFTNRSGYTDDTIMTMAVAYWLLKDPEHKYETLEEAMVTFAKNCPCPNGGYGEMFYIWLFMPSSLKEICPKAFDDDFLPKYDSPAGRVPYNSWGNGAAMRASAVGWKFRTLDETERVAALSASITHDHPEGIKGAQATAAAIYLARTGKTKQEIKDYIEQRFGYDLDTHTDEIRKTYGWEDSCQGTVPPAIRAFLDSTDFESAVRIAVSLGGDSDTLACITGGIAEAYYGEIPREIFKAAIDMLPESFLHVLKVFEQGSFYGDRASVVGQRLDDALSSRRYTPENISSLEDNEVFVFGSNLQGSHGGGAAAAAVRYFGAIWGQGVGMQGQCYAIPTMHGGVDAIRPYVDEFIIYAKQHPELTFLVTRIGCGIAGFRDADMAPLFAEALDVPNVVLPKTFVDVLKK